MSAAPLPPISPYKDQIARYRGCSGVRTSQAVGLHVYSDINSYLQLIVRKITEKCGSTQELMSRIRMIRMSENPYVTPIEFRTTLIKFNIILPQDIVDAVFNVFDSDRSGTMDFDEFATWIMNADTKPYEAPVPKNAAAGDTPEQIERKIIRDKILQGLQQYPGLFLGMRRKTSYMDFVSIVNRAKMSLNEKDARRIFLFLDKKESGFIDSRALMEWAKTGKEPVARSQTEQRPATVSSPPPLDQAVMVVTNRQPILLHKCLKGVMKGSGVKMYFSEFRQCLLSAGLGMKKKEAMQVFLALSGGDPEGLADMDTLFKFLEDYPLPSESEDAVGKGKVREPVKISDFGSSMSLADRRLREALRAQHCFKLVKMNLEKEDPTRTGWVPSSKLFEIINSYGCPMSGADFRLLLNNLNVDNNNRVDWRQFVTEYNPGRFAVIKEESTTDETQNLTASASSSTLIPELQLSSSKNESKNQLIKSMSALNLESARYRESTSSARIMAPTARPRTSARPGGAESAMVTDLKRKWTIVLRECQKQDPERAGYISREDFKAALEFAKMGKSMTGEVIYKLADTYSIQEGFVDYLSCFRNFLNELISVMPTNTNEFKTKLGHQAKQKLGTHPWDYQYKPDATDGLAYWQAASVLKGPEELNSSYISRPTTTMPNTTRSSMGDNDRNKILVKYDPRTVTVCAKCHDVFLPIWRTVRNEFKRAQLPHMAGCILSAPFLAILQHFGLRLSGTEAGVLVRSFKDPNAQIDILKFDEFLRVVLVAKAIKE